YMHLDDHARAHIEESYRRLWHDRLLRAVLAQVRPYPRRSRAALAWAALARPLTPLIGPQPLLGSRLRAMIDLAPRRAPPASSLPAPGVFRPAGPRRGRVALLSGCAQPLLAPGYNAAAIRLLNRHGIEVVLPSGEGCC